MFGLKIVKDNIPDTALMFFIGYNDELRTQIYHWLESQNSYNPTSVRYDMTKLSNITVRDYQFLGLRSGDWLVVYNEKLAMQIRLTFNLELCTPLQALIHSKV